MSAKLLAILLALAATAPPAAAGDDDLSSMSTEDLLKELRGGEVGTFQILAATSADDPAVAGVWELNTVTGDIRVCVFGQANNVSTGTQLGTRTVCMNWVNTYGADVCDPLGTLTPEKRAQACKGSAP